MIYLDTFVFMDILSAKEEYAEKAKNFLEEVVKGEPAVISSIMLSEIIFHISRKRTSERADEIVYLIKSIPNLKIIPADTKITKLAGRLRAKYINKIEKKLTYFDCIHLATAITSGCSRFITGDKGFKGVEELEIEIY